MSTHPYLPLYVDDYEAATAHLTPEEDGVYSRLLRLCWRTPGCSVPNDPAWIARKIRLSAEDYERVAQPVIREFFRVVRGRLVQKRLKAEYENISRKKSARVAAGKRGGDSKSLNTRVKAPSIANDLLGDTRAFPEPYPEPEREGSEDKSSGALSAVVDHDAVAWVEAVALLTSQGGMTEANCRKFFGRLLAQNKIEARDLLSAMATARVNGTLDPQGLLTKHAQAVGRRRMDAEPKRVGWV